MEAVTLTAILIGSLVPVCRAEDDKPTLIVPATPETLPQPLPLANPERSAPDEEQFQMAASYLRSQFSIPHHLVPSYRDTAGSHWAPDMAEDRIRKLPIRKNPKIQPDPSYNYDYYDYIENSNEFLGEDDQRYKRRPGNNQVQQEQYRQQEKEKQRLKLDEQIRQHSRPTSRAKVKPRNQGTRRTRSRPGRPIPSPSQLPQRRYPGPAAEQQNVNVLAAMATQLRQSLSSAFYGNRRQSTFPRIQYGPFTFGPLPLSARAGQDRGGAENNKGKDYYSSFDEYYDDYEQGTQNQEDWLPTYTDYSHDLYDPTMANERPQSDRRGSFSTGQLSVVQPGHRTKPDQRTENRRNKDGSRGSLASKESKLKRKYNAESRSEDKDTNVIKQHKVLVNKPIKDIQPMIELEISHQNHADEMLDYDYDDYDDYDEYDMEYIHRQEYRKKEVLIDDSDLDNVRDIYDIYHNHKREEENSADIHHERYQHDYEVYENNNWKEEEKPFSIDPSNSDTQEYDNQKEEEDKEISTRYSDRFDNVKDRYDQGYNHKWELDMKELQLKENIVESDSNRDDYEEGIINLYNILKRNHAIDEKSGSIKWGDKMWAEVEADWGDDGETRRNKYRVRKKKKEPLPEVKKVKNVKKAPLGSSASILSDWHRGMGEVLEKQPNLKFADDQREYVSGFKPTASKRVPTVNRAGSHQFSPSTEYHHNYKAFLSPNLENHSITSTSYDEKMIINLPRSSYNLPRSTTNLPRSSYNLHGSANNLLDISKGQGLGQGNTKTLQEITFRS